MQIFDPDIFKLAVENASDHILITDAAGVCLYANQAATKITGFTREEIIGKQAGSKELWGGQMSISFYQKLWQTIKAEKQQFRGEVTNRRKNGELYTAEVSISPVLDEASGEIKFFVAMERDISVSKQAEQAKIEFLSLASHQLRTPLAAINWHCELLATENAANLTQVQQEHLTEIQTAAERMTNLVNLLLNVSRIDMGTMPNNPEPISITELLAEILADLKLVIARKNTKIEQVLIPANLSIKCDRNLLSSLLHNLISNAVKYTPQAGKVKISCQLTADKQKLLVEVSDNGYGIPNKQQGLIFNKSFRADNIRKLETDGSGLGLYLVKKIIDSLGGEISFSSILNQGTQFKLEIPLSPATANAEQ